MRFVEGYREAVDWMYSDPQAIDDVRREDQGQPKP